MSNQKPQGEPENTMGPNLREQVKPLAVHFTYGGARAAGYAIVKWLLEISGLK